jgi:hypothetical protein
MVHDRIVRGHFTMTRNDSPNEITRLRCLIPMCHVLKIEVSEARLLLRWTFINFESFLSMRRYLWRERSPDGSELRSVTTIIHQ